MPARYSRWFLRWLVVALGLVLGLVVLGSLQVHSVGPGPPGEIPQRSMAPVLPQHPPSPAPPEPSPQRSSQSLSEEGSAGGSDLGGHLARSEVATEPVGDDGKEDEHELAFAVGVWDCG